ncbi:uncharacterized protein LOC114528324 [Dendronephthya gigantea]|uniref:uncharacterized protein LOC114528324 n=1 Tax=Dendronephthya gigantea TaxID=151771 RepID=UPI00106DB486|nr:uncharacterized protein LOC114528324 [Dendronephthya gigantea]
MASEHDGHCHDDCSEHEQEDDGWIEMERVYNEKSTEEQSLIEWFTKNVQVYLKSERRTTGGKYAVLSFGCGSGAKDRAVLAAVSSKVSEEEKILYHAVDPEASQIERFKESVHACNGSLEKVSFDFYVQTYENYMETVFKNENSSSKANLILFIDSLCHFSSTNEDVLVHCYNNVLAKNGAILVTLWNNQDFWFKIRETFGKDRESKREEKEGNDYLTIQEVEEVVKKRGWDFQRFSPEYSLDITECFDPASQTGKYLFDCLACFSNVADEVKSDPKKLFKFLKDSESIIGDKHFLKGEHGILVIYKQE